MPRRRKPVRVGPDEEKILLEMTSELIARLEIHDLKPDKVILGDAIFLDPSIYEDRILIPKNIHGKLAPEEWKPLIASQLIYHRNINWKTGTAAILDQLFWLTGPVLFAIACVLTRCPPLSEIVTAIVLAISAFAMIPVGSMIFGGYLRSLRRKADRQTLEILGNSSLVEVLKKIEAMGLKKPTASDVGLIPSIFWNPRIRDRIEGFYRE